MSAEAYAVATLAVTMFGKWVADWIKSRGDASKRADDADALRERIEVETEEWMRLKLAALLNDTVAKLDACEERCRIQAAATATEIAQLRSEFERLRTEHGKCPSLVREILRAVSKLDPYRTPTQAEMDGLRAAIRSIGGDETDITGLFQSRGVEQ